MAEYRTQQVAASSFYNVFTPAATGCCVLLMAAYAAGIFFPEETVSAMALSKESLTGGKVWQFITHALYNPGVLRILLILSGVLFVGSRIEGVWGTKSWIIMWAVLSVANGILTWLAMLIWPGMMVMGSAGVVYGLIGAYGLLFRNNPSILMFGAMKGQQAAILMIIAGVLMSLASPLLLVGVLGGAASGYGYTWLMLRPKRTGKIAGPRRKPQAFVDID